MTSTPRPTAASGRIPLWIKILMGVLIVIVIFVILAGVTLIFGRVEGTEFSPQTFNRRKYVFWQLPVVRLKVYSIQREDKTSPLERHLIAQKLIPTVTAITDWDLVTVQTGTSAAQVNDPQVLMDYLDMSDFGGYQVWLRWTEDHAELAKIFWPVIARLVRGNLYVHLPEFFRLARVAKDAEQFGADLTAAELRLHRELGARWERQGDLELALAHFKAALSLAPQDEELQQKCGMLESLVPTSKPAKK